MPEAVLLDTDIGTDVDDAIALALILAAPELDLRAVTTISGDTRLRARIARRLLALGGRSEVPVAAGVQEPILRQRSFLWLGHEGRGIVEDGDDEPARSPTHGVDLFIDTVLRQRPHVVAIGPLSNLAVAIMKEPAVIAAIPQLTLMGGALGRRDDVPQLEYNLGSDAEAAVLVLGAGIPTTLVPLDVTYRVFFTAADLESLRRGGSPLMQAVCNAVDIWAPLQRGFFAGSPGFREDIVSFLHDPLRWRCCSTGRWPASSDWRCVAIVDGAFRRRGTRCASVRCRRRRRPARRRLHPRRRCPQTDPVQ
jgi:purine nucleosidase